MLIRTSFFVVDSIPALAVSSIGTTRRPSRNPKHAVNGGYGCSSHKNGDCDEKEKEKTEDSEIPDSEIEGEKQIENLIYELKQRKIALESRLFELHGMKEVQSYSAHLRGQLKAKRAEIDELKLAVDSIRTENKRFGIDAREGFLAEKQLVAAKKTVLELQAKMSSESSDENRMKCQLEILEARVSRIRNGKRSEIDPTIVKKLEDFSRMELEVLEMRREKKELELEKRELASVLNAAHARLSKMSESAELQIAQELRALRSLNEELSKQVERLQKQRFGMVEELIYQRWLNCCLKFEIQNNYRGCSLSEETSSSSKQSSIPSWTSLGRKAKELGRGKINSNRSRRLIRRFSTSILPSSIFSKKNGGNTVNVRDTPDTPRFPRSRRVSFSDIVKKLEPDFVESASEEEMESSWPNEAHCKIKGMHNEAETVTPRTRAMRVRARLSTKRPKSASKQRIHQVQELLMDYPNNEDMKFTFCSLLLHLLSSSTSYY